MGLQVVSGAIHGVSRKFQVDSKALQGVSEGPREFQNGTRKFQEVSGKPAVSLAFLGVSGTSQGVSVVTGVLRNCLMGILGGPRGLRDTLRGFSVPRILEAFQRISRAFRG